MKSIAARGRNFNSASGRMVLRSLVSARIFITNIAAGCFVALARFARLR
jgi:hypothetical protein